MDMNSELPVSILEPMKSFIESIINVFETGSKKGDYGNVSIYHDGPGNVMQITYGRSQTTEYGHLPELLNDYVTRSNMTTLQMPSYVEVIKEQIPKLGTSWVDQKALTQALRAAGSDPLMQKCQDSLFEKAYWDPAELFFQQNHFSYPLSMLVIYDSYIHSGSILQFLRNRFVDVPPQKGGDEKKWIQHYCEVRRDWLSDNSRIILRGTVYRVNTFLKAIENDNWMLSKFPLTTQGITYHAVDDIV